MKKIDTFLRGITFLCCLFSMTTYAQTTIPGTGGGSPISTTLPCTEGVVDAAGVAGLSLIAVNLNLNHTYDFDLEIRLYAPDNTVVLLADNRGGSGDDYIDTVFSDTAGQPISSGSAPFTGTYNPEVPLSTVDGQNNGQWRLEICDGFGGDDGTLNSWSLTFGTVGPPPPPLPGSTCDNAEDITCDDQTLSGTTIGYPSNALDFCGTSGTSAPGRFYIFEGTGDTVVVNTCENTNFDTKLFVFTSTDCNTLTCITGNDDECGLQSQVSFESVPDTRYYIYVSGFGSSSGNFDLELTCVQPIENDTCEGATAINCGDVVTGNTDFANSENLPNCNFLSINTAPGVWHSIQGTGGDIALDLSGSAYDTKLAVFSGACDSLTCVASDDDDGDGLTSSLIFESNAGETYYVYVTGFGSNSGEYILSVDCVCDDTLEVSIDEDECINIFSGFGPTSVELTAEGQFGFPPYTYNWSDGQTGATVTVIPTETTTYTVTVTDAAGCTSSASTTVIFENVVCDDNPNNVKVNVCHNGQQICISPNAVQSHLNHGDSLGACDKVVDCDTAPLCDSRLKVPGPDAIDVPTALEISWGAATGLVDGYVLSIGTTPGGTDIVNNEDVFNTLSYDLSGLNFLTTYYVTIVPYNSNGVATEGCESSVFTTAEGPWCAADVITCDIPGTGNTITDGVINGYLDSCFDIFGDAEISSFPGVFFKFEGTGDIVTASLCGTDSDLNDTILGVYTGDCTELTCLTGNDDECGLLSEVEFVSEVGTTYYIYVAEFSTFTDGGQFDLSLTCVTPPPPLEACVNATGIECGDNLTGDDTSEGVFNDLDPSCGPSITSQGLFYKFEGDGTNVTVDTNGSNFDTKLHVFSGDCSAGGAGLICIDGDDDGGIGTQSQVSFQSTPNTIYYIYVSGFGSATGSVGLNLNCIEPPANDECSGAVDLAVEADISCSNPVFGTTQGAAGSLPACTSSFAPDADDDVWYSFTATGSEHTIIIENLSGSSDIVTEVFDACGGNSLVCQDSPNSPIELTGLTANTTYYFRIYTYFSGSISEFNVCVGTPPPPPGGTVDCGTVLNQQYCYGNNENTGILYTSSNGNALDIVFNSGLIESCCDFITIYNGIDNTGDIIYTSSSQNLAGGTATALSGNMYVFIDSDFSVSCASSSTYSAGWNFDVSCALDREASDTPTWNLYPNPSTTGEVQLDLTNYLNQDVSIQMTDFSGKVMVNNNESNLQTPRYRLSTEGMSYGIYFVRVATASGVSTKKLIIANK